jgi:hypothetical protein
MESSSEDGEANLSEAQPMLLKAWQCTLLILLLIEAREKELQARGRRRSITRARISQNTIRRLCGRAHLPDAFLWDLQQHMLAAGWALFPISPAHFAVIKLESVQGWGRISTKRIAEDLGRVARGTFRWKEHVHLLHSANADARTDENEAEGEDQETEE